jgi:hypothetical protein
LLGVGQITTDHEYDVKLRRDFFDHIRTVSWKYAKSYKNRVKVPKFEKFTNTILRVDEKSRFWSKRNEILLV